MPLLMGCTGEANHLGNPLLWPAWGVSSAVQNGIYGARRAEVSALVAANHPELIAQIANGGGPGLGAAMDAALIPAEARPALIASLQSDLPLHAADPETLVVALMVHGP